LTEATRSLEDKIDELLALQKKSQIDPETLPLKIQKSNTKSPKAWIEAGKSYSSRTVRKQCLGYWAIANGKTIELTKKTGNRGGRQTWVFDSLLKAVDEVLTEIINRKIGLYDSVQTFLEFLKKKGSSSWTKVEYRSLLPEFFIVTLGSQNFNREDFDTLVPYEKPLVETRKKIPVMDGVRSMLSYSTPQYRSLIGAFTNIGWRIEELLSRRWSADVKIRPEGYARVEIKAKDTKARYDRVAFLTPEVVNWLKKYHELLPEKSDWLFPGYKGGHLYQQTAEHNLKRLFRKARMLDDEDAIYSSHSFRTFADGLLSKAGLDRKYIELTIGHKSVLGAGVNYRDFDAIEQQWKERCLTNHALRIEPEPVQLIQKESAELKHVKEQNRLMLELFGHLMTPEIAQKLGFEKLRKLKVFSNDEIEKLLESGPDDQSLLEDKDDKAKNSEG
jgi:integrase